MEQISQKTLNSILKRRAKIEEQQRELAAIEEQVFNALKAGTVVQKGMFEARIKAWERRNVAWKQIAVRELGDAYCDRVLAATKPDKYEKLEVEIAG